MKGKLLFVAGGVIGYVLGARAGRKRYEQIKQAASRVWESPAVQKQVDRVEEFASQKLGEVPELIGNVAKKAASGVVEKMTSGGRNGDDKDGGSSAGGTRGASTTKASRKVAVPDASTGSAGPAEATADAVGGETSGSETSGSEAQATATRPAASRSARPAKTSKDESL